MLKHLRLWHAMAWALDLTRSNYRGKPFTFGRWANTRCYWFVQKSFCYCHWTSFIRAYLELVSAQQELSPHNTRPEPASRMPRPDYPPPAVPMSTRWRHCQQQSSYILIKHWLCQWLWSGIITLKGPWSRLRLCCDPHHQHAAVPNASRGNQIRPDMITNTTERSFSSSLYDAVTPSRNKFLDCCFALFSFGWWVQRNGGSLKPWSQWGGGGFRWRKHQEITLNLKLMSFGPDTFVPTLSKPDQSPVQVGHA